MRAAVGAVLRVEVVEEPAGHRRPDRAQAGPGRVVFFTRRDEDELRERQVDAEMVVADLVHRDRTPDSEPDPVYTGRIGIPAARL